MAFILKPSLSNSFATSSAPSLSLSATVISTVPSETKELLGEVGKVGSVRDVKLLPSDIRKVFVTAFDVPPKHHLAIQAAFQKYTDNSVSKTINLPFDSTVEDVRRIYLMAHELKCKGITIYRYDTKKNQVLSFDSRIGEEREDVLDFITAESEYAGGCHSGMCPF